MPTAIALTWGIDSLDEATVSGIAARAENTGRFRFVCGMTVEEAEGKTAPGSRLPVDIVRITIMPQQ